ncbi:MAG: EMC3/TMCO1 family protein [Nanoarchaeota archaeon]|nr:EMC3/TMCO1 family protein [Nanoarchaeota archaeon]
MKGMGILLLVMLLSALVASMWNSVPFIKDAAHAILDPTAGSMLDWNLSVGFLIIAALITLITTLIQKYSTDQKTLKELREESKLLNAEMKKYKEHPERLTELQRKQFEILGKTMPLTMRPLLFTAIPFVLFLRWFGDYFMLHPAKIFGLSWFWAYFISSIIFSIIFRKILKVQ